MIQPGARSGSPWLRTIELSRHYRSGAEVIRAVDRVDLALAHGEFLAVVGASGSGKSTLLNLIAGLDTPTAGRVEVGGTALGAMDRRSLARYRGRDVGMVFQSFNLIRHLSALQNVELALYFTQTSRPERRDRAEEMLERLGLASRRHHRPADLSGGEQQRVALARALVKRPSMLLADEPTGNLDSDNAHLIAGLMSELNAEGLTVILVTHDRELAARHAGRVLRMQYGRLAATHADPGEGASP